MATSQRSLARFWRALSGLERFPVAVAFVGVAVSLVGIRAIPTTLLAAGLIAVAVVTSVATYTRSRPHSELSYRLDMGELREGGELLDRWPLPAAEDLVARDLPLDPAAGPSHRPREVDEEIADALRWSAFVLVVGPAGSGKTTALLNAARAVYPEHRVLMPAKRAGALAGLIAAGPPDDSGPLPMLLVLDDLELFAAYPEDLSALSSVLSAQQKIPRWFVVLATARGFERSETSAPLDALRDHARIVEMPVAFTPHEKAALEAIVSAESGPLAIAAADWARTGIGRPISRTELARLAAGYPSVEALGPSELLSKLRSDFADRALSVALGESGEGEYLPAPSVLDAREASGAPVPRAVWSAALECATPRQALAVANAAQAADEWGVMEEALLAAVGSDDPSVAAEASLRLAALAYRAGDFERAHMLLEPALEAEGASLQSRAAYVFALIAMQMGRLEEARTALSEVLAREPDSAAAAVALAQVHQQREDAGAAEETLRRAAEMSEDPTVLYRLGELLSQRGETKAAREFLERTALQGHVKAMEALGAIEASGDRHREAERWLREAALMGSPSAAFSLGTLLADDEQTEEAEAWLARAMDRSDPEVGAAAALSLGRLTQARGDTRTAMDAFQRALDFASLAPAEAGEAEGQQTSVRAADSRVLRVLAMGPAMDEAQIASAALLAPNVVTEALSRLIGEGLVEALPGPSERPRYALASRAPAGLGRE